MPVRPMPQRIWLQTTLPTLDDDWSIWRFSLLERYLTSLTDSRGEALCQVRCAIADIQIYVRNLVDWLAPITR